MPWLGTMPQIDAAVQIGSGVAGAVVGQPFQVRRLDANTNVSVSSNQPIFSNYPASLEKTTKIRIENASFDLLCYEVDCDNRQLEYFDELTETGYRAIQQDVFVFAQYRPPFGETIWVRCESNIAITRPVPSAGQAAQQPASGWRRTPGYGGVQKTGEYVLTLNNGVYSFSGSPGATPAGVVAGLQATPRMKDAVRGSAAGKMPTALYREEFFVYLPLLPGEQISELDRLNFSALGDRYEVAIVFTTELTGLAGYVLKVEKLGT